MKFTLWTVSTFFSKEKTEKYRKYFEFKQFKNTEQFTINKRPVPIIEINNIEDLMELIENTGHDLLIDKESITIVDDYLD